MSFEEILANSPLATQVKRDARTRLFWAFDSILACLNTTPRTGVWHSWRYPSVGASAREYFTPLQPLVVEKAPVRRGCRTSKGESRLHHSPRAWILDRSLKRWRHKWRDYCSFRKVMERLFGQIYVLNDYNKSNKIAALFPFLFNQILQPKKIHLIHRACKAIYI